VLHLSKLLLEYHQLLGPRNQNSNKAVFKIVLFDSIKNFTLFICMYIWADASLSTWNQTSSGHPHFINSSSSCYEKKNIHLYVSEEEESEKPIRKGTKNQSPSSCTTIFHVI
jgi:hypothetical protein